MEGSKKEGIFPLTHVWNLKINQKSHGGPSLLPNVAAEEEYSNAGELSEAVESGNNGEVKQDKDYTNSTETNLENIYSEINDEETEEEDEHSNYKNETFASNTSHLDLKAPACFTQEATSSLEATVKPYGKSLYSYSASQPDELSFSSNEIIHLIEHYPGGWSRGRVNGRSGIFQTNYISIIVDCSPSLQEVQAMAASTGGNNDVYNNASEFDNLIANTSSNSQGATTTSFIFGN